MGRDFALYRDHPAQGNDRLSALQTPELLFQAAPAVPRLEGIRKDSEDDLHFQTSRTFFKNITLPIDLDVEFRLLDNLPPRGHFDFGLYVDL